MSKLFEQLRQLERLDQLIRLKATGCPERLATRLGISKRQLYRLIGELRNIGFPIEYCKSRQSYYYKGEVKLSFQLLIDEDCFLEIKGGEQYKKNSFFDFFSQSDKKWQWEWVALG